MPEIGQEVSGPGQSLAGQPPASLLDWRVDLEQLQFVLEIVERPMGFHAQRVFRPLGTEFGEVQGRLDDVE